MNVLRVSGLVLSVIELIMSNKLDSVAIKEDGPHIYI